MSFVKIVVRVNCVLLALSMSVGVKVNAQSAAACLAATSIRDT